MEQEIELRELLEIVIKRWKLILLLFLTAVMISAVVSFFLLDPTYQASTTLLVGKPKDDTPVMYQDVQLNRQLVSTYEQIARSGQVGNEVLDELNLSMTLEQLQNKITISQVADTEIIAISVKDKSADKAALLANGVANVFIGKIGAIMKIDNVTIIDPAAVPAKPIAPRKKMNVAIAGVLALMIGFFLAFALEYLDNTVKTAKDVEDYLGLPLLGTIPFYEGEQ
ncbi:MAG TPA: Wzz/FepE/Etk N-terminal domain-containing protein [Oscillospiraceae bacterium]|nr:Wzz/FepE/Etk N-terminal domain-containing protein [Oscillospiraceae bacterium]